MSFLVQEHMGIWFWGTFWLPRGMTLIISQSTCHSVLSRLKSLKVYSLIVNTKKKGSYPPTNYLQLFRVNVRNSHWHSKFKQSTKDHLVTWEMRLYLLTASEGFCHTSISWSFGDRLTPSGSNQSPHFVSLLFVSKCAQTPGTNFVQVL